jgi:hypothetical protein
MTRSRRAGPPRDEARHPPLYARMLALRHLAPSGFLCFVFLEGAIALGSLLALAELVSWWGVLVLPVTVAVMVKLNDVIAGAVSRAAVPPPRVVSSASAGWASSVPGTGRDPYVSDVLRDRSRQWGANGPIGAGGPIGTDRPALRSAVAPASAEGDFARQPRARDDVSLGRARGVDLGQHEVRGRPSATAVDANALNGPPSSRIWADELDTHQQRARQSASRHYE